MTRHALVLVTFLIVGMSMRETGAQTNLARIAEWVFTEGFAGELNGAPVRALGYEAPVPVKQKAFQGNGITHLFYVTNSGSIVLGYVDKTVTILWRIEGAEVKATAHGDMVERKMWQVPNSEDAELLAKEVSYWTNRWNEHVLERIK